MKNVLSFVRLPDVNILLVTPYNVDAEPPLKNMDAQAEVLAVETLVRPDGTTQHEVVIVSVPIQEVQST